MRKVIFIFLPALLAVSFLTAQSIFHDALTLNLGVKGEVAVATWEAETFDFGAIEQGTPVSHTFYFTNTGNKPLTISKVKASCGCTATDYSKDTIEPGETGYVKATYSAKSVGVFTKTVSVNYDAEGELKVLKLRGEVVAEN